jgi:hypothetical protein
MGYPIEELVLKPSFWKYIGVRILSAVGTAVGIWMIYSGNWIGWYMTSIFGLVSLLASVQLIPGSTYVRIHAEGLEVCFFFRSRHILWKDVTRFGVARRNSSRMVVYDFVPDYSGQNRSRALCRLLFGWDAALPDSFGMSCEELADLMNRCRETFSPEESRLPLEH